MTPRKLAATAENTGMAHNHIPSRKHQVPRVIILLSSFPASSNPSTSSPDNAVSRNDICSVLSARRLDTQ